MPTYPFSLAGLSLLALGASIASCSLTEGAPVRQKAQSLLCADDLVLPTTRTAAGSSQARACNPSQCYTVMPIAVGGRNLLGGTRLTSAGAPLDTPQRLIGYEGPARIATFGDDFLIAVEQNGTEDIVFVEASGADGSVSDSSLPTIPLGGPSRLIRSLVTVGQVAFVHYREDDIEKIARVAQGEGIVIWNAPAWPLLKMIPGNEQVLVLSPDGAIRLDAAIGQPLDLNPIEYSKFEPAPEDAVAHLVDGVYYIYFRDEQNDIKNARLNEDGSLIDAPDDFNELPASRPICVGTSCRGSADGYMHVFPEGEAGLLLFEEGQLKLGSDGSRSDGAPTDPPVSTAVPTPTSFSFYWSGTGHGLHTYLGSNVPLTLDEEGYFVFGTSVPAMTRAVSQGQPTLASNGDDFLATWLQGTIDPTAPSTLLAARIDSESGAILDDPPLVLGQAGDWHPNPSITTNGEDYFLAWLNVDEVGYTATLHYGTISASGETDFHMHPDAPADAYNSVGAAYDGVNYLLYWVGSAGSSAVRISPSDLSILDDPVLDPNVTGTVAVAGNTTPAPDMRTFLFARGTTNQVLSSRLRAESGTVVSTQSIASSAVVSKGLSIATDGTDFVAAWVTNGGASLQAALIDDISGEPVGNVVNVFGNPVDQTIGYGSIYGRVIFDGSGYFFIGLDGRTVIGRHYDATLQPTEDRADLLNLDPGYDGSVGGLTIASNTAGRSLILRSDIHAEGFGIQLLGRFYDEGGGCPTIDQGTVGDGTGGTSGDGDGDAGDGDAGDGDAGDGDAGDGGTTGDGDAGDGDATGDGGGDAAGDGDAGDGDATGDGDGDATGDGDAGDGDATGDGDAGDGDANGDGDAGNSDSGSSGDKGGCVYHPQSSAPSSPGFLLAMCALWALGRRRVGAVVQKASSDGTR